MKKYWIFVRKTNYAPTVWVQNMLQMSVTVNLGVKNATENIIPSCTGYFHIISQMMVHQNLQVT